MSLVVLQPNDERIGILTGNGEYKWPALNSAGRGYSAPNDNLRWIDAIPREDGSRRFVVASVDMLDIECVVNEPAPALIPEPIASEPVILVGAEIVEAVLAVAEPAGEPLPIDELPKPKPKGKGKK